VSSIISHLFFAVRSCISLESVDLSATKVAVIPLDAFWKCASLTKVLFPSTLKAIEDSAFEW
jgi:hypothetical protein